MRKILICLIITIMLCFSVSANSDIKAECVENTVNIEGIWNNYSFLNIVVAPDDLKLEEAGEEIGNKAVLFSIRTEADGSFEYSFNFPGNFDGGKYIVYISDGTTEVEKEIYYINQQEMNSVVSELNKSSISEIRFKELLVNNSEKLGVDSERFSKYVENTVKPLYTARGEYTVSSLAKACIVAVVTEELKVTDNKDEMIKENAEAFGIDYEKDYGSCSADEKAKILDKYILSDISSGKYQDIFMDCIVSVKLSNCTNYTAYGSVILQYAEFLNIDLSEYNKSTTNKEQAMDSLYRMKITDNSKLAEAFNNCVRSSGQQVSAPQNGGRPSGSGGGGGGGGSSKPSVPSVNADYMPVSKVVFSDISGHWAKNYIETLTESKIVSGFPDGSFKPEQTVTRSEFVKMLAGAIGLRAENTKIFNDVSEDNWNFGLIAAAANAKIISGFDGMFLPDNQITREDCAVILLNAMKYRNISVEGTSAFSDNQNISDYAIFAVGALNSCGIINGYITENGGSEFKPQGSATRAEAVKMISEFINYIKVR